MHLYSVQNGESSENIKVLFSIELGIGSKITLAVKPV